MPAHDLDYLRVKSELLRRAVVLAVTLGRRHQPVGQGTTAG
jgi:hypothetical protein